MEVSDEADEHVRSYPTHSDPTTEVGHNGVDGNINSRTKWSGTYAAQFDSTTVTVDWPCAGCGGRVPALRNPFVDCLNLTDI